MRVAAVLALAIGLTFVTQPEPASASIDVGDAVMDCNGRVNFNFTTIGVSLGYTLNAYAGRTPEELASAQYRMGTSTTPWPINMVFAGVSGSWQMPADWPRDQPIYVGVVPQSFPWGSFAINLAQTIRISPPASCSGGNGGGEIVSIGDRVWEDLNRNGVQDTGEPSVANVRVELWDITNTRFIAATTTNANGFYSFTGLPINTEFRMRVQAPTGYTFTKQRVGQAPDDPNINPLWAVDSDMAPSGVTNVWSPISGFNSATNPDLPNFDVGLVLIDPPKVSIGDHVWEDLDKDGVQDIGEPAVSGVKVELADETGIVQTATTDANGFYSFTGLRASGNYAAIFTPPAGYWFTTPLQGTDRTRDSNVALPTDPAAVSSGAAFSAPASGGNSRTSPDDPTIDAGLVRNKVSIGDFVWYDQDEDGVQDAGERPASGLTVKLLDSAGTEVQSKTTNAAGFYSFTDLDAAADYTVQFSKPAGYSFTKQTVAAAGTDKDSNPAANGSAAVRTPASGKNSATTPDDPTIDAGLVPTKVSVGDKVWADTDKDGVQDAGEPPVKDVTVNLLDDAGALIKKTTTDDKGFYSFVDLVAGRSYIIEFVKPQGRTFTKVNVGADDAVDSDAPTNGRVAFTAPTTGANSATTPDNPTIDAGFEPVLVSVGDRVWSDTDKDGLQDAGEPSVKDITVNLLNAAGTQIATIKTNDQGFYSFKDLLAGEKYTVEFKAPGWSFTTQNVGANDGADSDPGPDGKAPFTAPPTGANSLTTPDDPTIDAGLIRNKVSVGDHVWLDKDRDGIQDTGEPAVENVAVTLFNEAGAQVATTKTTAVGFYSFTNLDGNAKYEVRFVDPLGRAFTQQAAGANRALDSNATAAGIAAFTSPASGQNSAATPDDPTIDAGLLEPLVGTLAWKKVDSAARALSGSEWSLTPISTPGAPSTTAIAVTDCVAATAASCAGADKNPVGGQFSVVGLIQGAYELRETKAPAGYVLLTAPIPVAVNGASVVLADIVNTPQSVPPLPLTGGIGTDTFTIAGSLLLLLMLALGIGDHIRRRRRTH